MLKRGFTIIELLLVIGLISLVGTFSIVGIRKIGAQQELLKCKQEYSHLKTSYNTATKFSGSEETQAVTLFFLVENGLLKDSIYKSNCFDNPLTPNTDVGTIITNYKNKYDSES